MANIVIETDGKEVISNLTELISEGLKEKLSGALQEACLTVEATAKRNCPVGDGQLRQSITTSIDADNLEGAIGSIVEYAPYVEIGTGIYSSKGDGRKDVPWTYRDEKTGKFYQTKGMQPRPYLKPAAESNKSAILKCFEGLI